jgi:hypothetical protein
MTVERKLCADCGHPNLESEARCWACGGARFAPSGARPVGEPTISLGVPIDRTMAWSDRRPAAAAYGLAVAVLFAFFMSVLGYWIGRASSPAGAGAAVEPALASASQPVPLPDPPASALRWPQSPPTFAAPGQMTPTGIDPPRVRIRPKRARTPQGARQAPGSYDPSALGTPYQGGPYGAAPYGSAPYRFAPYPPAPARSVPYPLSPQPSQAQPSQIQPPQAPPSQAPRSRSRVVAQFPAVTAPTGPAPEPVVPLPSREGAVVTLRNDASVAVEVSFDGPTPQTVLVAPGGTVPFTLTPGSYRLRVGARGMGSVRSTLALAPERAYQLIALRRKQGDREMLVLAEPALEAR